MRAAMIRLYRLLPPLVSWPVLGLLAGGLVGSSFGTLFGILWAVTHLQFGAVLGTVLYFAQAGAAAGALVGLVAAFDAGGFRHPGREKSVSAPRPPRERRPGP
jgi:hypothetical protein